MNEINEVLGVKFGPTKNQRVIEEGKILLKKLRQKESLFISLINLGSDILEKITSKEEAILLGNSIKESCKKLAKIKTYIKLIGTIVKNMENE